MEKKTEDILSLTYEEKKKCRFECINQSLRLFECVVHKEEPKKISHGLRLFPIHLWKIVNGVPCKEFDNKIVAWYDLDNAKK